MAMSKRSQSLRSITLFILSFLNGGILWCTIQDDVSQSSANFVKDDNTLSLHHNVARIYDTSAPS
jgi:hypothetical protein